MEQYQVGIVVCGQAQTGRLEVLESFFKKRFENLAIIGISSVYARHNTARYTVYRNGSKAKERKLFNLLFSHDNPAKGLLFLVAYTLYFIKVSFAAFSFRLTRRNLIFIGIGCLPALIGVFLKKVKIIKSLIYYSIDYFPPANKSFLVRIFIQLDKFCVLNSDLIWSISPKVIEGREKFAQLRRDAYLNLNVPLTFDESLLRTGELNGSDRHSIVFVGTSGYFHGLHLLIEAMPRLIKIFPGLKVKIIGPGPWERIQNDIKRLNLSEYFYFLGFIEKEDDLFELVSKNSLGLALYVPDEDNPTFYADPGKPKLYAFCSVPIVISKTPAIAAEIDICGAGKAIDFNVDSLINAITGIMIEDKIWKKFRENAFNFAKRYTSKEVFEPAIQESLRILTRSSE